VYAGGASNKQEGRDGATPGGPDVTHISSTTARTGHMYTAAVCLHQGAALAQISDLRLMHYLPSPTGQHVHLLGAVALAGGVLHTGQGAAGRCRVAAQQGTSCAWHQQVLDTYV
jgi:hypothetical protein